MSARADRRGIWDFVLDNYLLLIAGTVVALVWANLDHTSYDRVAHSIHFAVNDIGMVFFFALATKEIVEAGLPGGPLSSRRESAVPVLAAVGGMVFPAGLFALQAVYLNHPELMRGWAIPCATDIAFSYMAARLIFGKDHPAIPFLLLLAIADDALGLILLALFYPTGPISLAWFFGLMVPAIAIGLLLRQRRVKTFWAYTILAGGFSWTAMYLGGIHPALAMVPIIPMMPHAKRDLGIYAEEERHLPDTMNRFHHWWHVPVQVILLLFGFANAGVEFSSVGPGTWMVALALIIGKPLGIVLATALGVRLGLRVPGQLPFRDLVLLGIMAGIGFTVALFFATASFPPGDNLNQVKMGALFSFLAFPLAFILGRVWRERAPSKATR
jgi:NhaA family Na+:H+ antiporter